MVFAWTILFQLFSSYDTFGKLKKKYFIIYTLAQRQDTSFFSNMIEMAAAKFLQSDAGLFAFIIKYSSPAVFKF